MKSMRIAAASSALVIVVAYLAIPIDMKKIAIAMIAAVGLFAACLHILRYGRLLETYARAPRPVRPQPVEEQESLEMDSSRHVA
jgi:hypothetical protein